MWSRGLMLLMLLLMMAVSTLSGPTPAPKESQKQKVKETLKKVGQFAASHIDDFRDAVVPLLELIPVAGEYLGPVVNAILVLAGASTKKDELAKVHQEFSKINLKLDNYHIENKWDTWASSAYYKPEMHIELAWGRFLTLLKNLQESTDKDLMERQRDEFISFYQKYEPTTEKLHKLLTAKGITFINNLGELLAENIRCHEKDILRYTEFILMLVFKGNTLNQFYYRVKKINTHDKLEDAAKIVKESVSALHDIYWHCVSHSMEYVTKDVKDRIDDKKDRTELAEEIRLFLDDKYSMYNWMVVAFKGKSSDRMIKALNSHVLTGFTLLDMGGVVRVAVARQVKGPHEKAKAVRTAIETCTAKVKCHEVEKKLNECKAGSVDVSKTYTAIHAFRNEAHDSYTEMEWHDTYDPTEAASYIYDGECDKPGVGKGKFVVMIKTDEEMKPTPCTEQMCGGKKQGKCVEVEGLPLKKCECVSPYYGPSCEYNTEDYKKQLASPEKPKP